MYVDCHSWFSSIWLISKCGRLWGWQWEKFSALCKWEAKNNVTSKEGILVASYSTVFINIISWSCIIFGEKVWLVECHNFLNQQPKMIKISVIYGIIYQSICWNLHGTFLNSLQIQEIFLCSYNSESAAFQCTQSPSVSFCKVEPSARSQIIHITQRFHCSWHAIVTLCSFGLCDSRCPIWGR